MTHQAIFKLVSAHGCKAPVNIICGGGVTPTVPVTASSEHDDKYSAQRACLDNSYGGSNGGETTHPLACCYLKHKQIILINVAYIIIEDT